MKLLIYLHLVLFGFVCIIYVSMVWGNCAVLQTGTHIDTHSARRSEYKPKKFQVCHCVKDIDRLPSIFSDLGMTKLFLYRIWHKILTYSSALYNQYTI